MTIIEAMAADLVEEARILKVKREVLKILERLPDDEARRRVVAASCILLNINPFLLDR